MAQLSGTNRCRSGAARRVQRAGDELLASAAFAQDEHVGFVPADADDGGIHLASPAIARQAEVFERRSGSRF